MSKTITITIAITAAAVLAAHLLTPAAAASKAPVNHEQEAVSLAPPGVDIVEHRRRKVFFLARGIGYPVCFWSWRYGYKMWVCY